MTSELTRVDPAELGLPSWYANTEVFVHDMPLRTRVELPRRLAELERELGRRPTVVFRNLSDHSGKHAVLGNPYPRSVLLSALGVLDDTVLDELARRLDRPSRGWISATSSELVAAGGLDALPIVQHRPGDVGRYITAGIGVTTKPDGSEVNLGVYRIQVVGSDAGRIFIDPRTDGYRNLQAWLEATGEMPISIFLGANPVFMLVAASRLPASGDDYEVAEKLLGERVEVIGSPPVPSSASHVITGRVSGELAPEGPFGEFKGYYVEARMSNVLRVDSVATRPGTAYPTIVAGSESGLTLMSLQNEYLMYANLTEQGFPVRSVRYPLSARAEFLTLIETDKPTEELLTEAMRFDVRTKVVLCGPDLGRVWQSLATFGFTSRVEPYLRKGKVEGERIGLVLDIPPTGRPVEY